MHPATVFLYRLLLLHIQLCMHTVHGTFFIFSLFPLYVLRAQYIIQCAEYIFLHGFSSGIFIVLSPNSVGIDCSSVVVASSAPWSRWSALMIAELSPLFSSCIHFPESSWQDCLPTTYLLAYCLFPPPFCFMRWYNRCVVVGVPLLRRFWSLVTYCLLPGPHWYCLALLVLLAAHGVRLVLPPFRADVIFKLVKFGVSHQLRLH